MVTPRTTRTDVPPAVALTTEDPAGLTVGSSGLALVLTFPGRRYHATPWGHHVNEGLVEWLPSPWRLLRGLLATGYTKLGWHKEGPPPTARGLIEKLASVLPRYRLPEAIGTHTRHYMPMARFKNGREETTMVLDTWAQIDDGSIGVHWSVELTADEKDVFASLARELGYLGRSESWVEATIMNHVNLASFDVVPGEARDRPGAGWEQVSLLAALPAVEYQSWREPTVRAALEALPKVNAKGKPLTNAQNAKQQREIETAYPSDLIACLQVDTAWLQELGWNQPPGTRKVLYWRRASSLEVTAPRLHRRPVGAATVEFMLLSMATRSGNLHALPPVTRTLPQGELLHRALLSRAPGGASPPMVLSGRDSEGKPLRQERAHRHAHLIHLDLDGDGHLDHVLVWAPMGLEADAQRMVRSVRKTFAKGSPDPLRVALAASGARNHLLSLQSPWGDRLRNVLGSSPEGSRRWRSITPFVPPRFLKSRGRNTLNGQIVAELQARGLPEPTSICTLDPHADDVVVRKIRHFVRRRGLYRAGGRAHSPPPVDCGFVVELEFAHALTGPIVLGYGCHYGLGVFAAV
jgi:CRISPR-associated protein Csb2